ncbi:MAG: hypothetical protein WC849_01165 [Candidatus Paceibacterota bacterium]
MEKRKLLRNVLIVGLFFGLAFWICFYSNTIFTNSRISFPIIGELLFSLMFVSSFGIGFYNVTNWYIKLNGKSGSDWIMINISSINLLIISSTMLIICLATSVILKAFLSENTNFLEKMTILWVLINLWLLVINVGSRKVIKTYEYGVMSE